MATTPMLILATTTPIIMTTAMLPTPPATMGTPTPWYRATLMLPIAPSIIRPTTRRPGRISATMVWCILAHKNKKRAALSRSLFMLDTFHARQSDEWVESSKLHFLRRLFFWPPHVGGALTSRDEPMA